MSIGSHNILSKIDRALAAYVISVGAGTSADVYPSKRAEDKIMPDTICYAKQARMLTPNSGVYVVTAFVSVRSNPAADAGEAAADKKEASEERVSATFDAFMAGVTSSSGALAVAITAAARATGDADLQEFTVQACTVESQQAGFDERGNAWTDQIELELVVNPAS